MAAVNEKSNHRYGFKLRCGTLPRGAYSDDYGETIKKCEFSATHARNLTSKSFYVYNEDDYKEYNKSRELISSMQFAVQNNVHGFNVYYQPIIHAESGRLFACEALLRYSDENFESVTPDEFVPLLEESGLIIPVGR